MRFEDLVWHSFFAWYDMATNIIETIQKNLDYPPLKKIDPNIQEAKNIDAQGRVEKIAQAAIPAVLAGIYRLSRKNDGASDILNMQNGANGGVLQQIFDGHETEAVQKVAQYGEAPESDVRNQMEIIASEAIRILRKDVGDNASASKLKSYMTDQRHNVLSYLPAAMQLGNLLHDETMDDRTNKMEGPVSSFMHKIESNMSGSGG